MLVVATLVLRLSLAPLIVLIASLAQRRLGPQVGGRVVALPLTTGPFLAVLCLQYGPAVAARAAAGIISGLMLVVGFCLGYAHLASRLCPLWSLVGALLLGTAAGAAISAVRLPWLATLLVLAGVALGLVTWPAVPGPPRPPRPDGAAAIAFRMAVTGTLVAGLATAARVVGPYLAGTLSSMPVILSVLVPATHRAHGPAAATEMVRGALVSIASTAIFIAVIAYSMDGFSAVGAFVLATLALVASSLLPWSRLTPARPC
jgi:hypothetical protein